MCLQRDSSANHYSVNRNGRLANEVKELWIYSPSPSILFQRCSFLKGSFIAFIQWNLDIKKGQGTGNICTRFHYIEVLFHIFYYYWGKVKKSFVIPRTSLNRASLYRSYKGWVQNLPKPFPVQWSIRKLVKTIFVMIDNLFFKFDREYRWPSIQWSRNTVEKS